jgi:hypothetical protein
VDAQFLDAYRRTAFLADTPRGRLTLHIGQCRADLDALMADNGATTWAYVTAFNPGSVRLPAEENAARQRQLERTVSHQGFVSYPGEGIGDDGRWPAEASLLVLGISRTDAARLGRQHGQIAVVYGEIHPEAELLMCSAAD